MVLAPFWTLGARGHALVWVSYLVCAGLYVVVALGVWRLSRTLAGDVAALVAAGITVAIAPFAWCALSGMETAFASALLIAMLLLFAQSSREGPPSLRLALVMAAASLARPEAMVIVFAVCGVCAVQRWRTPRAAAWWLAPLAAPVAWLAANTLLAGHSGVAKSHFYLPGFDGTYWWTTVTSQTGRMLKGLFWDGDIAAGVAEARHRARDRGRGARGAVGEARAAAARRCAGDRRAIRDDVRGDRERRGSGTTSSSGTSRRRSRCSRSSPASGRRRPRGFGCR